MKSPIIGMIVLCFGMILLNIDARRAGKHKRLEGRRSDSDSDSHRRTSKSEFSKESISEEAAGESFVTGDDFKDCVCSTGKRPVCGSDGRTYKSDCIFQCYLNETDKKITIQKKRACSSSKEEVDNKGAGTTKKGGCDCPPRNQPVCGSDNKPYDNECLMKCKSKKENVTVKNTGSCDSKGPDRPDEGLLGIAGASGLGGLLGGR